MVGGKWSSWSNSFWQTRTIQQFYAPWILTLNPLLLMSMHFNPSTHGGIKATDIAGAISGIRSKKRQQDITRLWFEFFG